MSEMVATQLGDLPSDWSIAPLGDLTSVITDGAHFSPVPQEEGELIANVKDMKSFGFVYDGCTRISKEDFDFLEKQNCSPRKNDVLLSKDGTIGRVVLYDGVRKIVLLSSIAIIRSNNIIDANYLKHVLRSTHFDSQLYSMQSGSALKRIVVADIRKLHVPYPVLSEQRKIAKILSTVDNLIEKTQALIDKYQSIKQGMMHDLFTRGVDENGQLRPSYEEAPHLYRESELGWIPKEWMIERLSLLADRITSGSRGWSPYYAEEGDLFMRIGNLTREHINFRFNDVVRVALPKRAEGARTRLEEGDVLISITADLGIIGVVPEGFETAYVNQHIALVRCHNDIVNQRWLGHFLSSRRGQLQFEKLNDSGAKAGLNLPTIAALKIAKPNEKEQDVVQRKLDQIDNCIEKQKIELRKLNFTKSGLMQDLLTGKVRVAV